MTELEIREARAEELPEVLALLSEDAIRAFVEPAAITERQRAAIAEIVADPRTQLLVGVLDGRIVATAMVNWLRVLIYDGGLICQIESVRTASDLRGRGLGTTLMQHVIAEARARGCGRVQLTTNTQRTQAKVFYERLGFRATHHGMKLPLTQE